MNSSNVADNLDAYQLGFSDKVRPWTQFVVLTMPLILIYFPGVLRLKYRQSYFDVGTGNLCPIYSIKAA